MTMNASKQYFASSLVLEDHLNHCLNRTQGEPKAKLDKKANDEKAIRPKPLQSVFGNFTKVNKPNVAGPPQPKTSVVQPQATAATTNNFFSNSQPAATKQPRMMSTYNRPDATMRKFLIIFTSYFRYSKN